MFTYSATAISMFSIHVYKCMEGNLVLGEGMLYNSLKQALEYSQTSFIILSNKLYNTPKQALHYS